MAQPLELLYCFARFRIQDHSRWMFAWGACQTTPNKAYSASVVTRSRKSKDCVTFSGKRENRASGGIGSARDGMLGSRIPPMHYFDLAIIIVYLVAITAFGARFRSGQKNLKDYFLGGRTAPWWAISLSIVSAETSTLTIIGTPALAFGGNLGFLQIVLGYLLARIVISVLFLPQYFRGEMFTAYELMRRRVLPRRRSEAAPLRRPRPFPPLFLLPGDARPRRRRPRIRYLVGDL